MREDIDSDFVFVKQDKQNFNGLHKTGFVAKTDLYEVIACKMFM